VEKDEDYIRTVVHLGAAVEGLIKHNNALDIYQEYFAEFNTQHSSEPPSARTLTVLKDPCAAASGVTRPVCNVNWLPDGGSKVALSYAILAFQQQPPGVCASVCVCVAVPHCAHARLSSTSGPSLAVVLCHATCMHALAHALAGMPLSSFVWDLANPTVPEAELAGHSQLVCAKFNLKDANLVGAGQYNGQFAYFDTRKGAAPVDATPVDISHRWGVAGRGRGCRSHVRTHNTRVLQQPPDTLCMCLCVRTRPLCAHTCLQGSRV
jgi:dynein intermediate chain 2